MIRWEELIRLLRESAATAPVPSVTQVAESSPDPYRVLISTIISLRTKDEVTVAASQRLFQLADTPAAMIEQNSRKIAEAIFPAGFYRTKAATILTISRLLLEEHKGVVPRERAALLALPGVGIKTANLTLGLAYGIPLICVDTHVHRIPNRLGWIETRTPEESEVALMKILPQQYWIEINTLLVAFGKEICTPVSPWCGRCPLDPYCLRRGVERFRG